MKEGLFTRLLYNFLEWSVRNDKQPSYFDHTMNITADHWLEGAIRKQLAGGSEMNTRRFLVTHFTSGWTAQSSIDFWNTPEAHGASAHVIIDRDGTIYQVRPFSRTCGHAGESKWKDPNTGKMYVGLNSCSIGIELANAGDMMRNPDVYPKTMGDLSGKPIPRLVARHQNGGPVSAWEMYPSAQMKSLEIVAKAIVDRYNIDSMCGHDQIAPNRKNDPGPAFNWQPLRNYVGLQV